MGPGRQAAPQHGPVGALDRALARISMVNVKLKSFLEIVLARLLATDGLRPTLQKHTAALPERLALGPIEPQPT